MVAGVAYTVVVLATGVTETMRVEIRVTLEVLAMVGGASSGGLWWLKSLSGLD
jgi:hypothetical protein